MPIRKCRMETAITAGLDGRVMVCVFWAVAGKILNTGVVGVHRSDRHYVGLDSSGSEGLGRILPSSIS
jgi:hypothetical protein